MNGRWFDERQLEAYVADGSEKFRKSDEKKVDLGKGDENNEDGEGQRLDKFGEWLEEEEKKKKGSREEVKQGE